MATETSSVACQSENENETVWHLRTSDWFTDRAKHFGMEICQMNKDFVNTYRVTATAGLFATIEVMCSAYILHLYLIFYFSGQRNVSLSFTHMHRIWSLYI